MIVSRSYISIRLAAAALCLTLGFAAPAQEPQAKNIILFIADGWGYNHIQAANYYQFGEDGKQPYETNFTRFAMSTYSARGRGYDPEIAWTNFVYFRAMAADSAATATTLASGVKTLNAAIGVDVDGKPLHTIVDRAESLGKSTGVVSSVQISHATPASFVAHVTKRSEYDAIGREMIADSAVDVIMGAGHPWYDESGNYIAEEGKDGTITSPQKSDYVGGEETWAAVRTGTIGADADGDGQPDPWTLIESKEAFQALMKGDTPKRVLGLAPIYATLQHNRAGVDEDIKDDPPYHAPRVETVPALAEMTAGALNVLDNNEKGFFLMVEGGAVDWGSHANRGGRMIEEMIDFGQAVDVAIKWVEANSNWDETLIVVTGDHECGYLTGPGSDPDWKPIVNNGKGQMPGLEFHSTGHTNQLIPCFVRGPGLEKFAAAADEQDERHGAYLDNAEVGELLIELLH